MNWRVKSVEASIADSGDEERSLRRSLGTWDLALMGIAVAVGAGIFSVGAQAAANFAGPSVIISFVLAAVTCGLAIMCYAEFASTVPVASSAYTFTYATMGELLAWIIGWDLILEMFTGAAVLAKYWGVYLGEALLAFGIPFPATIDLGGLQVSWPAFLIVAVFTALLVAGTKLTSRVGAARASVRSSRLRSSRRSVRCSCTQPMPASPSRSIARSTNPRSTKSSGSTVSIGCSSESDSSTSRRS